MDCLLVSWIIQSKMTSVFIVDRFPYAAEYELGGRLSILNFSFSEYPNCYFIFLFFTSRHERLLRLFPVTAYYLPSKKTKTRRRINLKAGFIAFIFDLQVPVKTW